MKEPDSGTLGFVASIISSLAWPVTLLVCVLLLRKYVLALIPLVRSVKYSDVEIRFGQEVAELAKATDSSLVALQPIKTATSQWEDLMKLSAVRPRKAIRMAFKRVEESILETARGRNVAIADAAAGMPMVVGALLLNNNVISTTQYELLYRLRELLDQAETAPPDSLSPESATEFVSLALRLAASISL